MINYLRRCFTCAFSTRGAGHPRALGKGCKLSTLRIWESILLKKSRWRGELLRRWCGKTIWLDQSRTNFSPTLFTEFFFLGSGCLCRKDLKLKTLPQFVKLQSLLLEIQGNNTLFVDLLKPKQIPFILLSVLICMTGGRKRVYRHAESNRRAQGGERKAAQQLSGSRVSDLVHRANC